LVEIGLAANGVGGCILTVIDQGAGIPVDLRERVFERYFQGSGGDARQYEGLGVELTIARAFAQRLGGDVAILDSDAGCRVQMTIPPSPAGLET
jgi:signal transduction histidine kinase